MEQLLEMAKHVSDQAEIYALDYSANTVDFQDATLHNIESSFQSGLSLRIIKDGKLGFAYVKNLLDREAVLQNALDSLKGEVEAGYQFPLTQNLPQLNTYDASIENVTTTQMVEECTRVCDRLKSEVSGEIWTISEAGYGTVRVLNTAGTDVSTRYSHFIIGSEIIYPGSGSGLVRELSARTFAAMPDELIDELIRFYRLSEQKVTPQGGKMKAVFMPNSAYTYLWRVLSGTNAQNVYEQVSPVADKVGKAIFSEQLTIQDDPLNDAYPGARAFDDEGVASQPFSLVENGVLQSFYYDLNYAHKLNATPTGHGYKTTRWGGETISFKPAPHLDHLTIVPGEASLDEIIASIDRGVLIEGVLGAHSGNIPNGDYSVGINVGLYVENGEIVGRMKDAMAAGNIYDTLQHVLTVENKVHPCSSGRIPAILCDGMRIATK